MIIVRLMGGLGNQMFQYAFGRTLAQRHKTALKFDLSFLRARPENPTYTLRDYDLDIFGLSVPSASEGDVRRFEEARVPFAERAVSKVLRRTVPYYRKPVVFQQSHGFDEDVFRAPKDCLLIGYWQSERFFKQAESIIRKDFSFPLAVSSDVGVLLTEISAGESVCLNVRRGDYVSNPETNKMHGVCGSAYFSDAAAFLATKLRNPFFYVFSDDIGWCQENIRLPFPTRFVGHEYAGDRFASYLRLMSACRHFIIPNSTFGWWAAWLSGNQDKIIVAPKRWFADETRQAQAADVVPASWVRL